MEKLTNQQAFDKALFGIRAQGYKRSMKGIVCMYRGNNGTKCAVGHCIPDELYDPAFDDREKMTNWAVISADHKNSQAVQLLSACSSELLYEMQTCHDYMPEKEAHVFFEKEMRDIAKQFDLVYTPVNATE